jgi:hypothetical protein
VFADVAGAVEAGLVPRELEEVEAPVASPSNALLTGQVLTPLQVSMREPSWYFMSSTLFLSLLCNFCEVTSGNKPELTAAFAPFLFALHQATASA